MKKLFLVIVAASLSLLAVAQDAAEKINQAQAAIQAQDYAKAYTLYDEALSNLGDVQVDVAINFNVGFAAYKAENLEGAVKYFDKAIEAGVNVPKCHEYKALAFNDKKQYDKAVASFEQAIALTTEDKDALVYKAAIAAYSGQLFEKAAELFGQATELGYKGETSLYYKALALKKLNKDEDYKATLIEGASKFPGDKKIGPALANIYVSEGNELYKAGAAILSAANQKVNEGTLKTDEVGYTNEVEKAKVQLKAAVEILEKAKALDASNANAQTLLDACKAVL